jgi:hypothetical protein
VCVPSALYLLCVCVCVCECVCIVIHTYRIVNVAAVGDQLIIRHYLRNVRCVAYKALP